LAAIGLLTAVRTSAAPPIVRHDALPIEGVVTNPDWVSKPSGEDVSRFYPPLPQMLGLSGRATVSCRVSELGILEGCTVSAETPAGMGFGRATLLLAPYFHMRPMSLDGVPVGGAQVNIPVRFAFPDQEEAAAESRSSPPPNDKALALGRRLLADQGNAEVVAQRATDTVVQIERQLRDVDTDALSTPEARSALQALRQAYADGVTKYLDRAAAVYARDLTEAQLIQAVAFIESPAGRAMMTAQKGFAKDAVENEFWQSMVRKDALARFCATAACLPEQGTATSASPAQGPKP